LSSGQSIGDLGDDVVGRGTDIHDDRPVFRLGLLEDGELAVEQRRRHEMAVSGGKSPANELGRPPEVDQRHFGPIADDDVAVAALESRAGHYSRLALCPPLVDPLSDPSQPRQPVGITERCAALHLLDIRRRMQRIAFLVGPTRAVGQPAGDRSLATAGNAHDHHDHRPVVSGMLVH